MGFWSSYRLSLKSLEVEEPIDVWLHRPVAYLVAKACYPLPISPDAVTVSSMLVGAIAGAVLVSPMAAHAEMGAFAIFLSTVLDCADGQLARMRGTSSRWGRMLDGVADLFTVGAVVPATMVIVCRGQEGWQRLGLLVLGAVTVVTSALQTTMFDHYKNVFLGVAGEGVEGSGPSASDDVGASRAPAPVVRAVRFIYASYTRAQREYLVRFDPWGAAAPTLAADAAAVYRRCAGRPMRVWKALFGTGSLMFGLALSHAVGRPDIFLLYRLVLLNAVFFLILMPMQRRASRLARSRIGASPAVTDARLLPS